MEEILKSKQIIKRKHIRVLIIILSVLIVLLAIVLITNYYFKNLNSNKRLYFTTTPTATPRVTQTIKASIPPQPTAIFDVGSLPVVSPMTTTQNGITYYSDSRIKFNYDSALTTTIANNKIFINYSNYPYLRGPYVEAFSKNPGDNLRQAIQKEFLKGYSSKNCVFNDFPIINTTTPTQTSSSTPGPTMPTYTYTTTPTPSLIPEGWTAVTIAYTQLQGYGDGAPIGFDSSVCPEEFMSTGGTGDVFEMSPLHPDIILVFKLAQYGLPASPNSTLQWFQTLQFVN